MSVIGYARVSTEDQNLEVQEEQLREAGCEKIFAEKISGSSTHGRKKLEECLSYVREGDVLVICRLDRLGRSIVDLRNIVAALEEKGVGFRCIHQPVDTTTPMGRLMLTLLGAFAEFELDIRKERQAEGIRKAKAEGRYEKKTLKKAPEDVVRRLFVEEKLSATTIAKRLKCGRATVYRAAPDLWQTPPAAVERFGG